MKGYLGYYKKIKSIPTVNLSDLSTREFLNKDLISILKLEYQKKILKIKTY